MDTPNLGVQPGTPQGQNDPSFQVMPQEGHFSESPAYSSPVPPPPNKIGLPPMPSEGLGLPEDNKPSFFRSKLFYIILGVLVLAGVGAGAYFILSAKKQTSQPSTVATTKLPKVWLQQYFNKEICDDQTICGDDADSDHDGLNNYNEFKAGTSPVNPDTDSDGLADGDEVNIYKIDPTLKYTDRRDIVAQNDWTDGFQIKGGYDPLTPGIKFTDARNQQIADDTSKYGLHEPTITTLGTTSFVPSTPNSPSATP